MNEDFLKIIDVMKFFDGIYVYSVENLFLLDHTIYIQVFDYSDSQVKSIPYYYYWNNSELSKTRFLPRDAVLISKDLNRRLQILNT